MALTDFRLPKIDQRLMIVGRNGSGKTQSAVWFLSHAAFDKQPFIIFDYKRDQLLNSIERIEEMRVKDRVPRSPGLYIVHPRPDEAEEVEDLMWKIWERGRTGVYIDEAHMLPDKGALRSLLTQGRSKRIPMILLAQRPAWINRFCFSEANFYQIFHLNDRRDHNIITQFVPVKLDTPLAQFNSWWHDVDRYKTKKLLPVPPASAILDRIDQRLPRSWFGGRPVKRRLQWA